MTANGEVEGPADHAGRAPRAHTVFQRPRRQTHHASRPPPTIVRRTRRTTRPYLVGMRRPPPSGSSRTHFPSRRAIR